jgi:hypothetical protein
MPCSVKRQRKSAASARFERDVHPRLMNAAIDHRKRRLVPKHFCCGLSEDPRRERFRLLKENKEEIAGFPD